MNPKSPIAGTFKIHFTLVLLVTCQALFAQRLFPFFGKLTDAEKSLTKYEREPDAAAVVLFDVGESYFFDTPDGGYDIRFTRTKRVKILTRAGFDEGTVSIPFYIESNSRKEKVVSIEAFTYTLKDGLTYKKALDPTSIFEEQLNNKVRVKKFTFPDLNEGCIIEYKYVLETPFHFNLPDWEFQSELPTLYSEYTVGMIPFYEYTFVAQGIDKFYYQNSAVSLKQRNWGNRINFNDMVTTFAMKDIPSFGDESYITSAQDWIMKMDFQLSKFNRPSGGSEEIITTWPKLTKGLLDSERFGKYLSTSERLARKIIEKEFTFTTEDEFKRAEILVQYVRSSFSWDGFTSHVASKSAKDFVEQKSGNAADINLFLVGLLRAAGLSADPVILSTRAHGKIRSTHPFEIYFNSVVVLVNATRPYLTEGTAQNIAFDRIPIRCMNEQGLVVAEGEEKWANLATRFPSIDDTALTFKIKPGDDVARVDGTIQATEYKAYQFKSDYENDSTSFKTYLAKTHQLDATKVRMLNYEKNRFPYVITFSGGVPIERIGNKLIVQPFLKFPMSENPLKKQTRTYPVDFIYARNTSMKTKLIFPEGFEVKGLPEPINMDNDLAQIILKHSVNGQELEIQADYKIKKAVYATADYSKLKFYLEMVVKGFNTPIVLEKK